VSDARECGLEALVRGRVGPRHSQYIGIFRIFYTDCIVNDLQFLVTAHCCLGWIRRLAQAEMASEVSPYRDECALLAIRPRILLAGSPDDRRILIDVSSQ
jgi:hypothetical protein